MLERTGSLPGRLTKPVAHNVNLGTDDWQDFYENLTTDRDTVHLHGGFAWGHPLADGEVLSEAAT